MVQVLFLFYFASQIQNLRERSKELGTCETLYILPRGHRTTRTPHT